MLQESKGVSTPDAHWMHIRSMRIRMRIGTCLYLFSNFVGTTTLYVLIALARDESRSEKHGVFRGIVGARVVPADRLHQAVQVSSERQDEEGVQPEETTTSACPKRLIKALISSTLQFDRTTPTVCSFVVRLWSIHRLLSSALCFCFS